MQPIKRDGEKCSQYCSNVGEQTRIQPNGSEAVRTCVEAEWVSYLRGSEASLYNELVTEFYQVHQ